MASGPRCGCRSRPPGGNQPERLPWFWSIDLQVRFVSVDSFPLVACGFVFES
jgi:hypothetical protein